MSSRAAHRTRRPVRRLGRSVVAVTLCLAGLVLASGFVGITVQGNALAREIAGYRADIAAAEAQHASWESRIAQQRTADYVREKARDFGYIGPNESLIAIEKSGQPSGASPAQAVSEVSARVARWIAFFFGSR